MIMGHEERHSAPGTRLVILIDLFTLASAFLFGLGAAAPLIGVPALFVPAFSAGATGILLGSAARIATTRKGQGRDGLATLDGDRLPVYGWWALRLTLIAIIAITAATIIRAQLLAPLADGGFAQSAEAMKLPWISMAMADLYCGFFLTSLWFAYREKRVWLAAILIANLWFWGNIVPAIYLLAVSFRASPGIGGLLLRPPPQNGNTAA